MIIIIQKGEQMRKVSKMIPLSLCTAILIGTNLYANNKNNNGEPIKVQEVDVVESVTSASEDMGSYTIGSSRSATKLNLSLKETPQSVKIITHQQIEDRGIDSYQDIMANITGVTLNKWDERIYPTARGFDIDYYQIDGTPTFLNIADHDPDLSIYDRVEVVKGANGLVTGAGNPAMSLNFIRKHANSKELTGNVKLEAGSFDTQSATLDVSTPLNQEGTLRARFIGKYNETDTFLDDYKKENKVFYGVVDADITDSTYLSIGASYQDLERTGIRWGGLPAFYSDGSRTNFDRSMNATEDWTYWNVKTKTLFADFEQYLYKDIKLKVSYSHMNVQEETALLYLKGSVDKSTGSGTSYLTYYSDAEFEEDNFDTYISVPFKTGDLEHEVIFGYSYNKSDELSNKYSYPDGYTYPALADIHNINITKPNKTLDLDWTIGKTIQQAFYLTGRFSLMEDLKLITGGRITSWEYYAKNADLKPRIHDDEFTPFAGLVYNIDDNHSIYTSYTEIFKPQEERDQSGNYLDPIRGKNYEVGLKGEYFDGQLNAGVSVFRIEQDNVAQEKDGVFVVGNPTEKAHSAAEGVTSKGVELEIAGNITDNWDISFGIANFEAKDAQGENVSTKSSRTTANFFTKYRVNKLSMGLGANYQSKFYTGSGVTKVQQDAYTIANAMLSYDVNKNLKLQMNVDNLFDKEYYDGIGTNSMVYGVPQTTMLMMKYSF